MNWDFSKIPEFEDFDNFDPDADEVWQEIKALGGQKHLKRKDIEDFHRAMMKVLRILSDFRWYTRLELDSLVGQLETTRRLRRLRDKGFYIHCRRTKADSRVFEYHLDKKLARYPMTRKWNLVRPALKLLQSFEDWKHERRLPNVTPRTIREFAEDHFDFSFEKLEEEKILISKRQEELDEEGFEDDS